MHRRALHMTRCAQRRRWFRRNKHACAFHIAKATDRLGEHILQCNAPCGFALTRRHERTIERDSLFEVDRCAAFCTLLCELRKQLRVTLGGHQNLAILLLVLHAARAEKCARVVIGRWHDREGNAARRRAPLRHEEEPECENDQQTSCE